MGWRPRSWRSPGPASPPPLAAFSGAAFSPRRKFRQKSRLSSRGKVVCAGEVVLGLLVKKATEMSNWKCTPFLLYEKFIVLFIFDRLIKYLSIRLRIS